MSHLDHQLPTTCQAPSPKWKEQDETFLKTGSSDNSHQTSDVPSSLDVDVKHDLDVKQLFAIDYVL